MRFGPGQRVYPGSSVLQRFAQWLLPPEKRLNLAQQLVHDLSQQILSGELPAGSKLPTEEAVTKARGVSRTVVREAMSRLQAEGLVETRRGIGTFVVDAIPAGDFQSASPGMGGAYNAVAIIELRLCLEVEAAAIAAQRATPEQLAAMRAALDGAVDTQSVPCMRTDFEFHLQIAQCTGNSFFIDTMTHLGHTLLAAAQPAVSGVMPSSGHWKRGSASKCMPRSPARMPVLPVLPCGCI